MKKLQIRFHPPTRKQLVVFLNLLTGALIVLFGLDTYRRNVSKAITLTAIPRTNTAPQWDVLPTIAMQGDLKLFWNINGSRTVKANGYSEEKYNYTEAKAHGLDPVQIFGNFPRAVQDWLKANSTTPAANPWKVPPTFQADLEAAYQAFKADRSYQEGGIFVHDMEFPVDVNAKVAFKNPVLQGPSYANTSDFTPFAQRFLAQQATWWRAPLIASHTIAPGQPVGVYGDIGPYPASSLKRAFINFVRTGVWPNFAVKHNQDPVQFTKNYLANYYDGNKYPFNVIHENTDFNTTDNYIMTNYITRPEVVDGRQCSYYVLGAVPEVTSDLIKNYNTKPLYIYTWPRFFGGGLTGPWEIELDNYAAEASMTIPYFCGAKGIILWGYEFGPGLEGQPYKNMGVMLNSVKRIATLSEKISVAQPASDEPSYAGLITKKPMVRKMKVSATEWIVMVGNPWQGEFENNPVSVSLGTKTVSLVVHGWHTDVYHLVGNTLTYYPASGNPEVVSSPSPSGTPLPAQTFITEFAVKAFSDAILPGVARFNGMGLHAVLG